MAFFQENTTLYKTALSDLQGAWQNLRDEVVDHHPFTDSDRLIFHIDEGMSWEAVRDLEYMKKVLLVIRNIAAQADAAPEIVAWIDIVWIDIVWKNLEEVFEAIAEKEK